MLAAEDDEAFEILQDMDALKRVTDKLELDYRDTVSLLKERANREFVYLKRHISPELAKQVKALNLDGIGLVREYRRYWP